MVWRPANGVVKRSSGCVAVGINGGVAVSANSVVPKNLFCADLYAWVVYLNRSMSMDEFEAFVEAFPYHRAPKSKRELDEWIRGARWAQALRMVGRPSGDPRPGTQWDSARVELCERPAAAVAAVCRARCDAAAAGPRFTRRCTRRRRSGARPGAAAAGARGGVRAGARAGPTSATAPGAAPAPSAGSGGAHGRRRQSAQAAVDRPAAAPAGAVTAEASSRRCATGL